MAGDFSPKERLQKAIDENYWQGLFPGTKDIIANTDYSIVNFESTIAERNDKGIAKIGSHLRTTYPSMWVLKQLGFKMITLANNHSLDYGEKALHRTINEAEQMGIETVGAGRNIEEANEARIIRIKGKNIAIINACEHEFSIATNKNAGASPVDAIETSRKIINCKKTADYVVVIIHGGVEHYQLPSMRNKKLYRYFVDCGADAVVNHHQHCFSGYEVYNGKPIFYGLGNFCFDSASDNKARHETYNYGYMVKLGFEDNNVGFELYPYEQCYQKEGTYLLEDRKKFDEKILRLNAIIANDVLLEEQFAKMALSKKRAYTNFLRPYNNAVLRALNSKGLFPSFIKGEKKLFLLSRIDCESHLDILKYNLN